MTSLRMVNFHDKNALLDWIDHKRQVQGLTRAELARRAGTTPRMLRHWQNDRNSPNLRTLSKVLAALGYEITVKRAEP